MMLCWGGIPRMVANAGTNKAASSSTSLNTRKLDEDTENLAHQKVPTELKKAIMQARQDKKLTQSQLAQLINEKPQIIQEYESGKAIPNQQIIAKLERALVAQLGFSITVSCNLSVLVSPEDRHSREHTILLGPLDFNRLLILLLSDATLGNWKMTQRQMVGSKGRREDEKEAQSDLSPPLAHASTRNDVLAARPPLVGDLDSPYYISENLRQHVRPRNRISTTGFLDSTATFLVEFISSIDDATIIPRSPHTSLRSLRFSRSSGESKRST
nr:multiprotein-bridging factor 1B-like [Ipomoea batatas]